MSWKKGIVMDIPMFMFHPKNDIIGLQCFKQMFVPFYKKKDLDA